MATWLVAFFPAHKMLADELVIRTWRITRGVPLGSHVWFDPQCEVVKIFRRSPLDGEVVKLPSVDGVDKGSQYGYLDRVISVSAAETEAELALKRYEQLDFPEGNDELPF